MTSPHEHVKVHFPGAIDGEHEFVPDSLPEDMERM